ncbi:MAG: hypothetical protein AB8B57_17465 [Congregibacter sp.]
MNTRFFAAISILLFSLVTQGQESTASLNEELQKHAVGEVPAAVMASARAAAPGVFFTGAQSYWKDDWRVYLVSGRLYSAVWNVVVREDGKLLRTESDNQDG